MISFPVKAIITILLCLQMISTQENLRQLSNVQEVRSMEELKGIFSNNHIIVIDFYAQWCGPCKQMGPIYDKYAEMYPKGKFLRADVDVAQDITEWAMITGMPTFKIFQDGKQVGHMVGANPNQLKNLLDAYVK